MHAVKETKDSSTLLLNAPPTLNGTRGYSNCVSGESGVAGSSKTAFCMLHRLQVEASTQSGDVFSKHQVAIKMLMYVDFGKLNDAALRRTSRVTASPENLGACRSLFL